MISQACTKVVLLLSVVTFMAVAGCGSIVQLGGTWHDTDAAHPRITSVLVVGVLEQESVRESFETEMARQLSQKGVATVASLEVMPHEVELTEDGFSGYFGGRNIDAVLVSRLLGVDTLWTYAAGWSYVAPHDQDLGLYSHCHALWEQARDPTHLEAYQTVTAEVNLYLMKDQKLVWSGTSQGFEHKSAADGIKSFTHTVIEELIHQGFLESAP